MIILILYMMLFQLLHDGEQKIRKERVCCGWYFIQQIGKDKEV